MVLVLPIPATKVSKPVSAPARLTVPVPVVVVVSFTLSLRTRAMLSPYAIRIIAVLAAAAGKTIVKSPAVEVLSPPKSIVATDLLESLLL